MAGLARPSVRPSVRLVGFLTPKRRDLDKPKLVWTFPRVGVTGVSSQGQMSGGRPHNTPAPGWHRSVVHRDSRKVDLQGHGLKLLARVIMRINEKCSWWWLTFGFILSGSGLWQRAPAPPPPSAITATPIKPLTGFAFQVTEKHLLAVFSRPYWVVRSRLWYDVLSVCLSSVCDVCIVAKRYVVERRRWYRWIGRW